MREIRGAWSSGDIHNRVIQAELCHQDWNWIMPDKYMASRNKQVHGILLRKLFTIHL